MALSIDYRIEASVANGLTKTELEEGLTFIDVIVQSTLAGERDIAPFLDSVSTTIQGKQQAMCVCVCISPLLLTKNGLQRRMRWFREEIAVFGQDSWCWWWLFGHDDDCLVDGGMAVAVQDSPIPGGACPSSIGGKGGISQAF